VVPNLPQEGVSPAEYEEKCPYCEGTGTCQYCNGEGKCWVCGGSGTIDDWEFFQKYKNTTQARKSPRMPQEKDAGDSTGAAEG
jgi:DnaJ-class molecular chaperone